MAQIILVCDDCHTVYLGHRNSVYCPECRIKPQPKRRCHPYAPKTWDPMAVACFHPGGTASEVWARIRQEVRCA